MARNWLFIAVVWPGLVRLSGTWRRGVEKNTWYRCRKLRQQLGYGQKDLGMSDRNLSRLGRACLYWAAVARV